MNPLLAGTSILGGFVGGMIALLAPCCVTVLLPAYFAAAFTSVRTLVRMTFLFAAGIAIVILPIALGLAALGQLFSRFHPVLFGVGGVFLIVLGVMTLRGRGFELPFGRAPTFADRPGLSIFVLGLFSGAASSCCAPVLIGVLTLTALTSSFVGGLAVALAYVFGMVFPLFLLALAGDRFGWLRSRVVRGTTLRLRVAGRTMAVHSTNLIGGSLFLAMGAFVLVLAATGTDVLAFPGQTELSAALHQASDAFLIAVNGLPALVLSVLLVLFAVYLARRARSARDVPPKEIVDDPS
ncbi:MAG: cytochrome c biogenesis CcdA family protein [Candidatus Limnocylindrales bacterium]